MKCLLLCTSVLLSAKNVKAMNGNDDRIDHSERKCGDWIGNRDFSHPSPFNVFLVVAPPKDVFSLSERATEHMQSLRANDLEPSIIELPAADPDMHARSKETGKRKRIRKTKTNQKSHEIVWEFITEMKKNPNQTTLKVVREIAKKLGCSERALYQSIRKNSATAQYCRKHSHSTKMKEIVQEFLTRKQNNPQMSNHAIAAQVGEQYSVSESSVTNWVNAAHPHRYFFIRNTRKPIDEISEVSSDGLSHSLLEGLRSTKLKHPFAEGEVLPDTEKKDGDLLGKNQNDSLSEEKEGANTKTEKTGKKKGIRKKEKNNNIHEAVAAFIAAIKDNPKKTISEVVLDIAKERGCTVRAMYKWIHQNKDAHQYIKKSLDPQKIQDIVQDFLASKANNPHLGNTVIATRVGAQYSVSLATVMRWVNKAHPGVYFFLQSQS